MSLLSHTLRTGKLTGLAVINVGFTVASSEARFAATLVTAQSVLAGCTIATWILHTLFDVHLTGLALGRGEAEEIIIFLSEGRKQVHLGANEKRAECNQNSGCLKLNVKMVT